MSPEQCRHAGTVDDKSDVYALGVLLFQLLAGHPPFEASGSMELIGMHLFEPPPPLASLVPEVPPELADFVHQMLNKERAPRPNMRDVALRLAEMAEQVAPAATEPQPSRPSVRLSLPPEAAPAAEEPPAKAEALGEDPSPSEPGAAPTTKLRAVTKQEALAEAARDASAPALQGNETRKTPAVLGVAASRPVPSSQETGPWQAFSEIDRRVLIAAAAGVLGLASIVIWRVAGSSSASARDPEVRVESTERGITAVPVQGPIAPPPVVAASPPRPVAETGRAPAGVAVEKAPSAPAAVAPSASPPVAAPAVTTTTTTAAAPTKSREQVERILNTAMTSYINGQYRQAIEGARSVQKQNPLRAWRIIGISACGSKNLSLVTESFRHLDKLGRQNVVFACDKTGIRYTAGHFKLSD